jgi:hypothetical protein
MVRPDGEAAPIADALSCLLHRVTQKNLEDDFFHLILFRGYSTILYLRHSVRLVVGGVLQLPRLECATSCITSRSIH